MSIKSKKVTSIIFNWFYSHENGEEYKEYIVGKEVVSIEYHEPLGSGDAHYCDVLLEDGTIDRVFNINSIIFE